jgi:hypothetical protein
MKALKKLTGSVVFIFSFLTLNSQLSLADSVFHPDSLRRIVEVLAADSMQGRFTGTLENFKAASFIAEEYRKAGLSHVAGNAGFFQEIQPAWYNVMGAIRGRSRQGQLIIFSAHYDHIGTDITNKSFYKVSSEDGDTIYNGANDNASGVAVIISLAKYFKRLDNNERTLLFVAFTGEELGLLGAKFLAEKFVADSIVAMINIEMIGREEFKNSKPFVTGYDRSNLLNILNRKLRAAVGKNREKEFFTPDPYPDENLFRRSDHFPFALKGVPAHSVQVTSSNDKFYHHPNDETETLDFRIMKRVINGIAIGATGLVTGEDTPTRIRKAY